MYYLKAKLSEGQRPIAWSTAIAPAEFLEAMNIITVYPENHAALAGARKMGVQLAEHAEARGYSSDICSYARADFGAIFSGQSPVGGLPRPNLLVCCNNTCQTVTKWYENLARHFQVPLVLIDVPFNHRSEISPHAIEYIVEQFHYLVEVLEQVTGNRFNWERFWEVVDVSSRSSRLWREILEMGAHRPCPFTAFHLFNYMAPIVMMRGSNEALEFYQFLKSELEERIASGYAAVPGEEYRLMWDGIPVWFEMGHMHYLLKDLKACLVCSSYTDAWILEFAEPTLEAMAKTYASIMINRNLDDKLAYVSGLIEKYSLDGIIHHSNRSCKPACFGVYEIHRLLQDEWGLPVLAIDADQCDSRAYSRAQTDVRIQAFIEALKARHRA
ncbi:MAG: 2-hydroxyacyl-CoA dehydratase [Clostridia bacterium]|nr:2-hydroxyacyl-CoA dehydratase [Clostridia bacterium]